MRIRPDIVVAGVSDGQALDRMTAVPNTVAPAAIGPALRADPTEAGKPFFFSLNRHEGTETAGMENVVAP